jgi:hypothetical protein
MHGTRDTTVAASVSSAAADFYRQLGGAVVREDNAREMAHTFPTPASGSDCATSESPYVGKCGFDGAGEILSAIVSTTVKPADSASGELREFDQSAYLEGGKDAQLADKGYVYVPLACSAGETCGLHIALLGCQQNADAIGEAFARDAGYNRWADARHLVVLYPQTRASYAPLNPKACWDWWGYSGPDYDTRQGAVALGRECGCRAGGAARITSSLRRTRNVRLLHCGRAASVRNASVPAGPRFGRPKAAPADDPAGLPAPACGTLAMRWGGRLIRWHRTTRRRYLDHRAEAEVSCCLT